MPFQFTKHYTREEARALLPQVRLWLDELTRIARELGEYESRLGQALGLGDDLGGDLVNRSVEAMASFKELIAKFQEREIQIKDLDRGLIDFPSLIGEKEVFLCWEKDEDDIEFWHDLDSGYAGREKI